MAGSGVNEGDEAAVQVATIEDITHHPVRRNTSDISEPVRDQSLMKKLTQLLPLNIPVARKVTVSGDGVTRI